MQQTPVECTAQSLLQRFDENEDDEISWKELNSRCENGGRIESSTSFLELCASFVGGGESNQSSAYLHCSKTSSAGHQRVSLHDPGTAESFCDILVEHGCLAKVQPMTSPPIFPRTLTIVAGSLLFVTLLTFITLVLRSRAKPSRSRTNDDNPSSNSGSEVNDFPQQQTDQEWSSIESGSSIVSGSSLTNGSSFVNGQMIRRVAQGRIVVDEASRDFVSLKKEGDESAEAFALQGTEPTLYDFESIDGDVASSNNNNTTMYFDCVPFPSSSTAL